MKRRFRAWVFPALSLCLGLLAAAGATELVVRWFVPAEVFSFTHRIYRSVARLSPGIGYTYRPNLNTTAFGVDLRTNHDGFRGPDWDLSRRGREFRVVLLGDSHAFGYGVSFSETVGERLAAQLGQGLGRSVEVLNFGVNGYNAEQIAAVYDQIAPELVADLLVVLVSSNDHQEARWVDDAGQMFSRGRDDRAFVVPDHSLAQLRSRLAEGVLRDSRAVQYLALLAARRRLTARPADQQPSKRSEDPGGSDARSEKWFGALGPEELEQEVAVRLEESVAPSLERLLSRAEESQLPTVLACFCVARDYRVLLAQLARRFQLEQVELLAVLPGISSWEEAVARYGLGWDPHFGAAAHEIWGQELARAARGVVVDVAGGS